MKKQRLSHQLDRVVKNPKLQVIAGIVLLVMTLFGEFFQPHHGFIVIGVYWSAQALPEILQALERIARWDSEKS